MSPPTKHILLFGDQSVETLSGIQALVRNSKTNPMARRFLQEATDVIQLESSRLNSQEYGWDKPFDSLLGLAEDNHAASRTNTIVSTALMTVGRLGQLIIGAEHDPKILGSSSNPVEIVALCGGLLPAAAAVAAKDTSELFGLSKLIIAVAFRLAAEVQRRAKLVEDTGHSWGRTYIGLEKVKAQEILDRFHAAENIPPPRQVAIGVVADSWLTLVGPPSSLQRLAAWSPEIGAAASLETNVPGPIHSSCLPAMDTSKIVGVSPLLKHAIDNGTAKKAHLYSPGSCKEYAHSTLGPLLEEMVEDIAHNVLHVSKAIQDCVDRLDKKGSYRLSVMGSTNHLAAMKKALKLRAISFQTADPSTGTEETVQADQATRGGSDLIAVVGMSGRFPGSDSVEAFWEDLVAGKSQVQEIPKSRFDLDTYFDPTGEKKNSTSARHGCFLDGPGLFDHRLFNISPREAAQMDPAHRLLLTIGYEALQQAGYNPQGSGSGLATGSSRIATYFGQAADEWREILNQKGADIYYVPGFSRAFGPARLHYQYKWSGPSYALDSACSTSATAVSLACAALTARECDTALAGGASVLTSPNTFSGLSRAGMLSTTGGCRTYHDDADGYCRAEGAGVVVLKRLEDALRENDNVLAVIRGSARTYSAAASSMTHPSAEAQEDTYLKVLRQSCLSADEIAYVEMHGTGTQAGDVEEMASVSCLSRGRTRDNPLTVGAVKANVGHGEGAAAITSLIKVIVMLRERQVPPQPGPPFTLNRKFPPLSDVNIKIATKSGSLSPSPRGDKKIKALVNSFDASGGNVTLAVQEPPPRPTTTKPADPRGWHVVAVSARSAYSLQQNRIRLLDYLESRPETRLADLAYSTTARRIHEALRCAYTGSSTGDIVRQLRKDIQDHQQMETASVSSGSKKATATRRSKNRSRIFLFTGQGSQYAGMGAHLFRDHDGFRSILLGYQELATGMGLPNFIYLISDTSTDMSDNAQASTAQTQLAIVALEIALAQLLKAWGITPDLVIGHSLGEYAALCVAGVLSVSDTLLLVGRRAVLMEKHLAPNTHAMLATSLTGEALSETFGELSLASCGVACENAPSVTVASGTVQDIETLQQHLSDARGMKTSLLRVPYGFHSDQVDPILEEFQQVAMGLQFGKPKIPIVSTLTATVERGESASAFSPAYLAQQARHKVMFVQALEACRAAGLADEGSLWVEIGPDPVLTGLARRTLDLPVANLIPTLESRHDNWRTISIMLRTLYGSGLQVNWPEVHKPFVPSLTLLDLPTYAFDMRDFWTPYKEPERVVQTISADDTMASAARTGLSTVPGFPTSSIHRVEDEKIDGNAITATFASSISHPSLLEAVKGHGVNGHTICPLGVFHDMALTAASYLFTRLHHSSINNNRSSNSAEAPSMSIQAMDMMHALVLTTESLDATIYVADTYRVEDNLVEVMFTSNSGPGRSNVIHGKCQVQFTGGDEKPSVSHSSPPSLSPTPLFLVQARIDSLRQLATTNQAHRLAKPVVYQLFSGVVSYAPIYQAIEEVIMDHSSSDAVATVKLPDNNTAAHPGKFHTNPYWTDAVLHLAGFVLNSGLRYPNDIACLATGFQMWRSAADLVAGATYTSYVCMQEQPADSGNRASSVVTGDCYVFKGTELVQATLGIKFLKLKKAALDTILGVSEPASHKLMTTKQSRQLQGNHTDASSRSPPAISETINSNPAVKAKIGVDNTQEMIDSMLAIIAEESGCTIDDMADDSSYIDLGIDSVMSITILSMVSRNLSVDLPASFFLDNETIGESKAALRDLLAPPVSDSDTQQEGDVTSGAWTPSPDSSEESTEYVDSEQTRAPGASRPTTPGTQSDTKLEGIFSPYELVPRMEPSQDAATHPTPSPPQQTPPALIALVKHYQGPRSNQPGTTNIFFLADETGSTFNYMYLPSLGPQTAVYGVDSPFSPAGSKAFVPPPPGLDVPGLAAAYLAAIRAEQPAGPYVLGGAAGGAVLAFECARMLTLRGEEVRGLVLLDRAGPMSRNNCGGGAVAPTVGKKKRVKPGVSEHVNSMTAILDAYTEPVPLSSGVGGMALLVLAEGSEEDGRVVKWSDLVPGLQMRRLEAVTGDFLSTVNLGDLVSVLSEALV